MNKPTILDPFEAHSLQVEENIRRMKNDKRLNLTRKSKAKPLIDKHSKRVVKHDVLGDCTNTYNKNKNSESRILVSGHKRNLDVLKGKKVLNEENTSQGSSSVINKKISVFDFVSLIKRDKPITSFDILSNKYLSAYKEIAFKFKFKTERILYSNDSIINQSSILTNKFLDWFNIQKYNYEITLGNIDEYQFKTSKKVSYEPTDMNCDTNKLRIVNEGNRRNQCIDQVLYMQNYLRRIYGKSIHQLTHKVSRINNLSVFMSAVEVLSLKSMEKESVILLKADKEIIIEKDDFLILSSEAIFNYSLYSSHIPIYTSWRIFKN